MYGMCGKIGIETMVFIINVSAKTNVVVSFGVFVFDDTIVMNSKQEDQGKVALYYKSRSSSGSSSSRSSAESGS